MGLGLAVARGFVEAMHGELHLDDTPGGGLTAIITLRAAIVTAETPASRVLVVDDEPQILRALDVNLRARGYGVDLAASGEEALVHASEHPPDLIVLDLGLPGISGIEVIAGVRGWSKVPIVVLSARDAERDKIDALDAGADDYVTKPFGMGELLARVPRGAAPRPCGRRRADGEHRRLRHRPRDRTRASRRRRRAAHSDRMGHRRDARSQRGQAREPAAVAAAGVGSRYGTETNYLRVHMAHIRRKLEPDPSQPRYFVTEPGMGYRFESVSG